MEQLIIIRTSRPAKIRKFLEQEKVSYQIYDKPKKSKTETEMFADYGEAIKDREREEEIREWETAEIADWSKRNDK
jgi:hypothetical protein